MKRRPLKWLCILLTAVAMVAGACSGDAAETTTTSPTVASTTVAPTTIPAPPPTTTTATTTTLPDGGGSAVPGAFASFRIVPLLGDATAYPGPPLPATLDDVLAPGWLAPSSAEAAALLEQGFVVVPADYRQFQHAYASALYQGEVFFVTTDAGYHFMHLAFSKVLRDLEQVTLLPILEELVTGLVAASRAQAAELAGTELADAASRAQQLYEAAAVLLGLDVGPVGPLAEQEVALAMAATQLTESPTTSFGSCGSERELTNCVDYSLFKPRGHYTRNEGLERYFRAMSMLGQASFFTHDADSLRVGVLAARPLVDDATLSRAWELVYEPTAFMVGLADDYTPFELAVAADTLAPGWRDDPAPFADAATVEQLAATLEAARPVEIDPENAAMRIMGVRLVLDSYVYDQLRWPYVGEAPDDTRVYSTALDLAAVFGSDLAYRELEAAGERHYLHFDEQFALMQALVDGRTGDEWARTVYDAWLYAMQPVLSPHGTAFPEFMQTPGWEAKSLQTGLGSYTELKHDTILYSKQSFAAEGGFEPPPQPPRHWVEPDPVAWERMASVVRLLQDGLTQRGLVASGDDADSLMSDVAGMLERMGRIASDELAGAAISTEDNDWLEGIGSVFEVLSIQSSDWDEELAMPSADDTDAALIADIMRSTLAYLEIGTGRIDQIMVLVPNDQGTFQVAVGGVYSYYEFWRDAELGRLTDEEWRALLDGGEAPERPAWEAVMFAG